MAKLKTSLNEFSMHHNQRGISLVEVMVAIVISTMVMFAAYGSYSIISKNYEFQKDMKYISQTARSVVKMIARDVRMAGYQDFNSMPISEAIKVTDSSNNCCDRIDIIYDKSVSKRIKISYYTKQHLNRNRLMKLVMLCTVSDCSKTSTLESEQPIADYVEDLQFNLSREGAAIKSSANPQWGTGKIGWFKPKQYKASCADVYPPLGSSKSGKVSYLTDDDMSTSWTCKAEAPSKKNAYGSKPASVTFTFDPPVRLLKVKTGPSAHIDGGRYNKYCMRRGDRNCYYEPFGSKRSYSQNIISGDYTTVGTVYPPARAAYTTGLKSLYNQTFKGGQSSNNCECYSYYNQCTGSPNLCTIRNSTSVNDWSHYALISSYTLKFPSPVILDYNQCCFMGPKNVLDLVDSSFTNTGYVEVPEILFYGEIWDGAGASPDQVEVGLLLRSPNEHQTKNKNFSINLGNRSYASNDKFVRDSFSTSVMVRNLYYATH